MNQKFDRRSFIKLASTGAGCLAFNTLLIPRFTMASQRESESRKNVIVINLAGGMDDLYAFPMTGVGERGVLHTKRAPLMVSEESLLSLDGPLALSPEFSRLYQEIHLASDLKLIGTVGFPDSYSRSHYTAQRQNSTLNPHMANGYTSGWISRARNSAELDKWGVWGLGTGQAMDFLPIDSFPPLVTSNLGNFTFHRGPVSASDMEEFSQLHKRLVKLPLDRGSVEEIVRASMESLHDAMPYVQDVHNMPLVGDYGPTDGTTAGWRTLMRDIVQVLIKRSAESDSRNTLILSTFGGFDTHTKELGSGNLPDKLTRLSEVFSGAATDLRLIGNGSGSTLWDNTVILVTYEFGRKTIYNGSPEDVEIDPVLRQGGTDHGAAYTAMVMGGAVNGGPGQAFGGDIPSLTELNHERGYREPIVDIRNVYAQALTWAGFNSDAIVPGNWNYNLQLFNS